MRRRCVDRLDAIGEGVPPLKHLKQTETFCDLTQIHAACMDLPRSRCRGIQAGPNLRRLEDDSRDLRRSDMQTSSPAVRERTGYALFDDRQVLVDANAEIFGGNAPACADFPKMDLVAAVGKILPLFRTLRRSWPSSRRTSSLGTRRCGGGKATCCRSRRRPSTETGSCCTSHPQAGRRHCAGQHRHNRNEARPDRASEERGDLPLHHRQPPAAVLGGRRGKQADPLREPGRIEPAWPRMAVATSRST